MRIFHRNERCVSQPSLDTEQSFSKNVSFSVKIIFYSISWGSKSMFLLLLGLHDNSAKGWKIFFVHPPFLLFFLLCWNSHFHENWNQEGQSGQIDQNCAINCWIPGNVSNKNITILKIYLILKAFWNPSTSLQDTES